MYFFRCGKSSSSGRICSYVQFKGSYFHKMQNRPFFCTNMTIHIKKFHIYIYIKHIIWTCTGEGLKSNNTLKWLTLNNITDKSIIDGLKTNNTLKRLWLMNNQLSSNMISHLNAIQQIDGSTNRWIKRVSTSGRDVHIYGHKIIIN